MRIHLIAIGGAVMHNLAIALHSTGHEVTGSDDEIYNPSRDRLKAYGLLPEKMGWDASRITPDIDCVILGMHARKGNPELEAAQQSGIPIYSFPEFVYQQSMEKTRIVIAGSHGKTTTTSMIMHILKENQVDFDYLVGAQLEGFETMVRLSDAPIIVLEGDEYLSSPIDRRPKILHYYPHVAIITGIAWDHINVFPTFDSYLDAFRQFVFSIEPKGTLIYFENDPHLKKMTGSAGKPTITIGYKGFEAEIINGITYLTSPKNEKIPLQVFGKHNIQNLQAAYYACRQLGLTDEQFYKTVGSFKGAAKRLQLIKKADDFIAYRDFAHAPSKVEATVKALKDQYPDRQLVACVELHTFSSLNRKFLPHYKGVLDKADFAYVFFSEHTLKMKKLPLITKEDIQQHFQHQRLKVFTRKGMLHRTLKQHTWQHKNLLMMSSGTFAGTDFEELVGQLKMSN
jgi:UDP-N-acetylmuramate: L-alanyl-gamma-D-glutamyl-meso-diaminopimelate ligase